jgi:hypothetical protein
MNIRVRKWAILAAVVVAAVLVSVVVVQRSSAGELFAENQRCCQLPFLRNVEVTYKETRKEVRYTGEIGQDKWVLEKVFPGVTNGYFVDVGSGHGTIGSNSLGLELRGWTGIYIDPFPI